MTRNDLDPSAIRRILHVFRLPKGGLFRHVYDLVKAQHAQGYAVGLLCDADGSDVQAEMRLAELEPYCTLGVHRVTIRRYPALSDFWVGSYLKRHFKPGSVDVLHGHGAKGGLISRWMARRLEALSVYTPHGGALHFKPGTLSGSLFLDVEKFLRARTDGIIFESHYIRGVYESVIGLGNTEARVIYNGLYREEFRGLASGAETADFLFLGELRRLKGIETLVLACERIVRVRPFTLAIAGSGPDEQKLKAMIQARGLESSIRLLGEVHPARDALRQARCLVLPSLAESMPYAVLEALGGGLPVIAANVGGLPEIFRPYESLLVEPGNDEQLADRMLEVLAGDESFLASMSELHESVAARFQLDDMTREVGRFYQSVHAASGGRALLSI